MRFSSAQEIDRILDDPAASFWLKSSLRSALFRDSVDAANDGEILARVLAERCQEILRDIEANPRVS